MLIIKNNGFHSKYVYGGGSIFTTLSELFGKAATSAITSAAAKEVVRNIGNKALSIGKTTAKELGKQAIESGKTAALEAGKKLVEKSVTKALTPKSQQILNKLTGVPMEETSPDRVAKTVNALLTKYADKGAKGATKKVDTLLTGPASLAVTNQQNLSTLIDGSGQLRSSRADKVGHQSAIHIRDLVRKLNGRGLKQV